jgi:hypothetical protein
MKNREPFQIKNLLIFYNFLMVILSGYMVYEVILQFFFSVLII